MTVLFRLVFGVLLIAACCVVGAFFLEQASEYLQAGQLTYSRKGLPPITVSTEVHVFSFYYQVAFWVTMAAYLLLFVVSMSLFALAKLVRIFASAKTEPFAAFVFRSATVVFWSSFAFFSAWFILRILRGALI